MSVEKVIPVASNYHVTARKVLQEAVERCEASNWQGVVILGYSRQDGGSFVEIRASDFLSTDQVLGAIERAKFKILERSA